MKQNPSALALEGAVENLYITFEGYRLHDRVEGCPCCVNDEDSDRLHSKPLRALSSDALSRYAFKAITTWGIETDFKHFLPRLFELVTDDHSITTEVDCEVLFGKLTYADWHHWPKSEQNAINDYFLALWHFLLEESPQFVTIDDFLCGFAQAIDDLSPYLLIWQRTVLPSAISHFLDFLDGNTLALEKGKLSNGFWEWRKMQMHQVVRWTLDPAVTKSFEQNLDACVLSLRDRSLPPSVAD